MDPNTVVSAVYPGFILGAYITQIGINFQYFMDPNTVVSAVYPGYILGAYITQIGIYHFPTCIVWNPLVLCGERTAKRKFSLYKPQRHPGVIDV
jgi:hypothetical protein